MKWGLAAAVASAAAVAAASGAELLACDCAADQPLPHHHHQEPAPAVGRCDAFRLRHSQGSRDAERAPAGERVEGKKFAPRFDGLRFIETLVTAHR
ncbi:uncharacterized protein LOC121055575 [Oryza brachyantha]|uniref:uncharacterized protein LOC121055575 n=1 Tax=Oryza brachyantha TaxID=4533 RepID=UPI001ADA085E|nr:uncharacterized protein LOC121055575 [Oryza brachyantha]